MEKSFLTKRYDGLFSCTTDADYELLKSIKPGESVEVKRTNERIMWQHKRFWLALKFVFNNMHEDFREVYPNQESLRKGSLIQSGHIDIVIQLDGQRNVNAGSMSFLSLGQKEFEQVYSSIIDSWLKYIITDFNLQQKLVDLT